jgi:quercetin dioxygenase-like cupin family protein
MMVSGRNRGHFSDSRSKIQTMSLDFHSFKDPVIVRAADAERLVAPFGEIRLLADSHATGGTVSTVTVRLNKGAPGAQPHRHDHSAEMFYVIEGVVILLCGETVLKVSKGDFAMVPPGMAHAFSADSESGAELLIVITPGVERFDYFRKLIRVVLGQDKPETLAAVQDQFDTHFLTSAVWKTARQP